MPWDSKSPIHGVVAALSLERLRKEAGRPIAGDCTGGHRPVRVQFNAGLTIGSRRGERGEERTAEARGAGEGREVKVAERFTKRLADFSCAVCEAVCRRVSLHIMGIPAPPFVELGTIGFDDSLILMVLALVVFGPRRLPQIGRQIGKLMYEFRKASNDFKFQMEEELRAADEADRRRLEEVRQRQLAQPAQEHGAAAEAADQTLKAMSAEIETARLESSYTESAYPYENYEGNYAEPQVQEAPGEETELRVAPPATGEPVPAQRPGKAHDEGLAESSDEESGLKAADAIAAAEQGIAVEKAATAAGVVTGPAGRHG